jgi:hypothetical protein
MTWDLNLWVARSGHAFTAASLVSATPLIRLAALTTSFHQGWAKLGTWQRLLRFHPPSGLRIGLNTT